MKRFYMLLMAVPVLAMVAAAQDETERMTKEAERLAKMKAELDSAMGQMKVIGLSGAAMGAPVKGAPYSAVEVTENNQVLADGTRIHNENQTSVYRDSQGRVRRETPQQTIILDPVAGTSFILNPKTMTATKTPLTMPLVYNRRAAVGAGGVVSGPPPVGSETGKVVTFGRTGGETATFEVRVNPNGNTAVTVDGRTVDPSSVAVQRTLTVNGEPVDERTLAMAQDKMKAAAEMAASGGGVLRNRITAPGKSESLGTQMIEGVNAEGTRFSTTLETGAIGNDRPIQVVNERWYSPELKTVILTKHSDPRMGEDIFRLTNINRSEPGADLFQVPTSYQIVERK